MIKTILTLSAISLVFSAESTAAQTFIKTTGDWSAFKDGSGKSRSCYIASTPQKETGNYKRRGDTFVLISHRPGEGTRDVFELRAGYSYKRDSSVTVVIDGQKFDLFTQKSAAWAKDAKTDRALARAMIRGSKMIVTGMSARGTTTVDTYSLRGFTAAYKIIGRDCGVR